MKITTKSKILLTTALAGATAAYLLDPVAGGRRRARMAQMARRRSSDIRDLKHRAGEVRAAVVGDDDSGTTDGPDPSAPRVPARDDVRSSVAPERRDDGQSAPVAV